MKKSLMTLLLLAGLTFFSGCKKSPLREGQVDFNGDKIVDPIHYKRINNSHNLFYLGPNAWDMNYIAKDLKYSPINVAVDDFLKDGERDGHYDVLWQKREGEHTKDIVAYNKGDGTFEEPVEYKND